MKYEYELGGIAHSAIRNPIVLDGDIFVPVQRT